MEMTILLVLSYFLLIGQCVTHGSLGGWSVIDVNSPKITELSQFAVNAQDNSYNEKSVTVIEAFQQVC